MNSAERESDHYKQTSHTFIPRYNGPDKSQMDDSQTEIYNSIIASRPRTGISGPFGPWLSIPKIAGPAQQLGQACRYGTSLSFRESELVILLTGAKHKSHTEFDIHVGEALKAGITMQLIESIPRDDKFSTKTVQQNVVPFCDNDRETQIVLFAAEILETSTVSGDRYSAAKNILENDRVLVEITSIIGYYTFCAYTLNVFQIPSKKL
jgi:4-carboxymuconolactone decarboxylase